MKLPVKVVPGSSQNCIAGWLGDALKIRVKALAEQGKANASVEQLIAEALGVSKNSVRVVSGNTSARKIIEIQALSETEVRQRLSRVSKL